MIHENCAFVESTIPHHLLTVCVININSVLTLAFSGFRPLRMETSKKWRRRSDWKSANAKGVRTKTHRAEMTGAPKPRRDVVVHQLRNSPRTPPNSPSKWTPSLIQSSTTEMGRENYFTELFSISCLCAANSGSEEGLCSLAKTSKASKFYVSADISVKLYKMEIRIYANDISEHTMGCVCWQNLNADRVIVH